MKSMGTGEHMNKDPELLTACPTERTSILSRSSKTNEYGVAGLHRYEGVKSWTGISAGLQHDFLWKVQSPHRCKVYCPQTLKSGSKPIVKYPHGL